MFAFVMLCAACSTASKVSSRHSTGSPCVSTMSTAGSSPAQLNLLSPLSICLSSQSSQSSTGRRSSFDQLPPADSNTFAATSNSPAVSRFPSSALAQQSNGLFGSPSATSTSERRASNDSHCPDGSQPLALGAACSTHAPGSSQASSTSTDASSSQSSSSSSNISKSSEQKTKTIDNLVRHGCSSHHEVTRFITRAFKLVLPPSLFGGKSNFDVILTRVQHVVSLRRCGTLSLHQLMQGIKVQNCDWLRGCEPTGRHDRRPRNRQSAQTAQQQTQLLGQLIYWVFNHFMLPLLRNNFYCCDGDFSGHAVIYYRHRAWRLISSRALVAMRAEQYRRISRKEVSPYSCSSFFLC